MKQLYKVVPTIKFDQEKILNSLLQNPDVFPASGPPSTIDVIRNKEQAKLITDTIGINIKDIREILVIRMPPNYSNTIHSDGDERFCGTLIPLTKCNQVYMQWWEPIDKSSSKDVPNFPLFGKGVVFKTINPEEGFIKDRTTVEKFIIANVNDYHNVKNEGFKEEWFLSIRFKLPDNFVLGQSEWPESFETVEKLLYPHDTV